MRFFFIIYILISFNPCASHCFSQSIDKLKASDTIYLLLYNKPKPISDSLNNINLEVTELGLNRTYHISNKEIKGQRAIFTIKKEDTGIPINKDIFVSKNRDVLITPQFIDKEGLLEIFYYTLDLNKYKKHTI